MDDAPSVVIIDDDTEATRLLEVLLKRLWHPPPRELVKLSHRQALEYLPDRPTAASWGWWRNASLTFIDLFDRDGAITPEEATSIEELCRRVTFAAAGINIVRRLNAHSPGRVQKQLHATVIVYSNGLRDDVLFGELAERCADITNFSIHFFDCRDLFDIEWGEEIIRSFPALIEGQRDDIPRELAAPAAGAVLRHPLRATEELLEPEDSADATALRVLVAGGNQLVATLDAARGGGVVPRRLRRAISRYAMDFGLEGGGYRDVVRAVRRFLTVNLANEPDPIDAAEHRHRSLGQTEGPTRPRNM